VGYGAFGGGGAGGGVAGGRSGGLLGGTLSTRTEIAGGSLPSDPVLISSRISLLPSFSPAPPIASLPPLSFPASLYLSLSPSSSSSPPAPLSLSLSVSLLLFSSSFFLSSSSLFLSLFHPRDYRPTLDYYAEHIPRCAILHARAARTHVPGIRWRFPSRLIVFLYFQARPPPPLPLPPPSLCRPFVILFFAGSPSSGFAVTGFVIYTRVGALARIDRIAFLAGLGPARFIPRVLIFCLLATRTHADRPHGLTSLAYSGHPGSSYLPSHSSPSSRLFYLFSISFSIPFSSPAFFLAPRPAPSTRVSSLEASRDPIRQQKYPRCPLQFHKAHSASPQFSPSSSLILRVGPFAAPIPLRNPLAAD